MNRRDVLSVLMGSPTSTRSAIARATGLSQPTVGKIVDDLIDEGVLLPTASAAPAARMGRPGYDLALNSKTPSYLAIQLGVIHTRMADLTIAPPPIDQWTSEFATPRTMKGWLSATVAAAKKALRKSTKAVLVSVPGVLDDVTGQSILSPNVRWLEGENVTQALSEALNIRVFAAQELRCMALGHFAIDNSADSYLLVDFGNGVGSAPVIRGRLLQGQLPLEGELGHTPVMANRLKCGCGGTGCLETLVSREKLLGELGIDSRDWHGRWREIAPTLKPGNLPAEFRKALEAAALGIAGSLNVLGLDRVILTGYLSEVPPSILNILSERIQKASLAGRFRNVQTTVAPRRRLAGLASFAMDRVIVPG